ncbi:MAG: hypothetical protein SFT90_02965 [Rickettsiales bacterium]|nr:hypothetical protein [Rickettsiales bacterium]
MKKLIIFILIFLIGAVFLYKSDIQPEIKEVRKEIKNEKLNFGN